MMTWNQAKGIKIGSTAATHYVTDAKTGDMIGLMNERYDNHAVFFRLKANDVKERVLIGKIATRGGPGAGWFHSFGLTDKYLVLPEHPVTVNVLKMMLGYPINEFYSRDASKNTIIHLMEYSGENSGKFRSFELDHSA